ncbi:hypothetical protein [Streptomyces sp. NPDC056304]|uniref:hypothetical protein n=1 Tax=Streptomyces sp. NPDC056304 TaxID=3345778 RepID=UPI0035E1690F
MTSSSNRASKKTASVKPSKPPETVAERKARLAEERREKLAAQMPKFSLAGFKGSSSEAAASEPLADSKDNAEAQVTDLAESASSIFAGFTGDDGATSLVDEAVADPVVPSQQGGHTATHAEHAGAATNSAASAGLIPQDSTGRVETSFFVDAPSDEVPAEAASAASEEQPNRTLNHGREAASGTAHSPAHGSLPEEHQQAPSPAMRQSAFSSPAPAQSIEVAHRPEGRRGGYSISVAQQGGLVPRRQRRPRVERFDPNQRQSSREEALRELQASAPRYSALLVAYRVGQLSTVPHENRNVHLYGAAFEQLANQGTSDKALFMQLTGQRHKLTPAHYVDAVLEAALGPLDPMCVDEELIEDEKDHVEKLADMAYAYRSYILNNEYLAGMEKQRFTCTLRKDINAKVSRMMDLLSSMPTIKIQPFEIISAVVADYLNGLPDERSHVESFFEKSTVTTYQ